MFLKLYSVVDKIDVKLFVVIKGEIKFDYVDFVYDLCKLLFKKFDLMIKLGEKVGLVGCSGVGKLILMNLLFCFYDI